MINITNRNTAFSSYQPFLFIPNLLRAGFQFSRPQSVGIHLRRRQSAFNLGVGADRHREIRHRTCRCCYTVRCFRSHIHIFNKRFAVGNLSFYSGIICCCSVAPRRFVFVIISKHIHKRIIYITRSCTVCCFAVFTDLNRITQGNIQHIFTPRIRTGWCCLHHTVKQNTVITFIINIAITANLRTIFRTITVTE